MPAIGRLYLPREALTRSGITATDPATVLSHPNLGEACAPVVARARDHFEHADAIMTALSAPHRADARVMGEVYKLKLDGLMARGWAPPRASGPRQPSAIAVDPCALRRDLMPRSVIHIIGAGLAGLAAAVRLDAGRQARASSTKRPVKPAGVAAPITIPRWT